MTRHGHSLDDAAPVEDAVKEPELGFGGQVADVGHFQPIAQVGFVAAVARHGVGVSEILERRLDLECGVKSLTMPAYSPSISVNTSDSLTKAHFQV